ncbi:hypothetical protein Gpo141_00012816 [Globisporangium polare]
MRSSELDSYYSENGSYVSVDDLRPSEDGNAALVTAAQAATTEPLVVDHSRAATGDWSAVSPAARHKYLDTVRGRTPEEQAMWKRMAQLHLQAESLYQFTKKNSESLLQSNPVGVSSTEVLMPPLAAPPPLRSLSHRMSID